MIATLSDELGSGEPPSEESQRTETLVRHGARHVDPMSQLRKLAAQENGTRMTGGGATIITSAHVWFMQFTKNALLIIQYN